MVDERTSEYLRSIGQQKDERTHEILKVGGPCKCSTCMAKRLQEIRDKVLGQMPGNFIPELSPNYNPNTGMMEYSGRPVGTFGSSANGNRVATKWTIKD